MRRAMRRTTPARMTLVGLAIAATTVLGGCEEEDVPPPRYPFTFTAHADNEPLAGVTLMVNDTPIGETNAEGVLSRDLTGPEGARVSIQARCPEGHRSPDAPQVHTLRRVLSLDPAAQARGIETPFSCPPEMRDAVVVVRTGDIAGLPIFVDGTEVTRTDASGTAHLALRMAPQSSFEVRIATNLVNERLRPSAPSRPFTVPDADTIFVYDQTFEEEAPPRRRRRRRAASAPVRLPIRIGGR